MTIGEGRFRAISFGFPRPQVIFYFSNKKQSYVVKRWRREGGSVAKSSSFADGGNRPDDDEHSTIARAKPNNPRCRLPRYKLYGALVRRMRTNRVFCTRETFHPRGKDEYSIIKRSLSDSKLFSNSMQPVYVSRETRQEISTRLT